MSRVLSGLGAKVGIGVVCGLAGTAWFAGHHGGSTETSGGGAAFSRPSSSRGGGGLSRWIPWDFVKKLEPSSLADVFGGAIPGKRVDVTVTVVDVDGRPVGDADVEVKANAAEYATANLSDADYESLVKAHPEYEGSSAGSDETSVVERGHTDRNGVWQAKLKPGVALTFVATASDGREGDAAPGEMSMGYEGSSAGSGMLADSATPQQVQVEIAPPSTLIGEVLDENGRPVHEASVSLVDLSGRSIEGGNAPGEWETDRDGMFRLPLHHGGAFDVQVSAAGYRTMTEPAVQVLPGQETHVDITLQTAAQLAGVVVGPDGRPLQGVSVQALPDPPDTAGATNGSGYTDEDGAFNVDGLAPGRYDLTFTASGMLPRVLSAVSTGNGLVREQLSAGATLHLAIDASRDLLGGGGEGGRGLHKIDVETRGPDDDEVGVVAQLFLASADGSPIPIADVAGASADVAAQFPAIDGTWREMGMVELDANGHGEQDLPALPPGRFVAAIRVGSEWSTPRTVVALYDGGSSDLHVRLPDGSAPVVAGVVHGADGRPAAGATAWLEGGPFGSMSTTTDDAGRFQFGSLPHGSYTLMVESAEGLTATQPLDVTRGGRVDADVTLPGQNGTMLTDQQAVPPQTITLDDVVTDNVSVNPLPRNDDASAASPEARFQPPIRVEPTDRGLIVIAAPAANGGPRLFGGDRVVAIEGTDISTMDPYEAMNLLSGQPNSLCAITVDRPATHQTLTVSLARTSEAELTERYEMVE